MDTIAGVTKKAAPKFFDRAGRQGGGNEDDNNDDDEKDDHNDAKKKRKKHHEISRMFRKILKAIQKWIEWPNGRRFVFPWTVNGTAFQLSRAPSTKNTAHKS